MARRQVYSPEEAMSILEDINYLEDASQIDAVYIPPDVDTTLTDEEDFDDDILGGFSDAMKTDIAGKYEIHTDLSIESNDGSLSPSKKPKLDKKSSAVMPVWEREFPTYTSQPTTNEAALLHNLEECVGKKTPTEVFSLYFTDEVWEQIVTSSKKYASDQDRQFTVTVAEMKRFFGILLLTGYHVLPNLNLYWSNEEDKNVSIVSKCLSHETFEAIRKNLHLCNNTDIDLDKNDKFAKLRPIINLINEKNMQFGIFSHQLSIGEQMLPCFGRNDCTMTVQGKPVRFGFKLWCLCSPNGYLYQFIPHAGIDRNVSRTDLDLGENVVLDLLSIIKNPANHRIYFDKYFSSYKLFGILKEIGYFATGAVREDKTLNRTLTEAKSLEDQKRGSFDYSFDKKHEILLVRWYDSSVINVATNNGKIKPLDSVIRFDRKAKKMINISQPQVIADYSKSVGGVQVHDSEIANYRIRVRGKKWWWPLFINLIDSALVNSWKIYNLANGKSMSHLQFRSYVAVGLMRTEAAHPTDNSQHLSNSYTGQGRPLKNALPSTFRFDNIGHVIEEHRTKCRRRCRQCGNTTIYLCSKCQVHLHAKCFEMFHSCVI